MKIIANEITLGDLKKMASELFGNMVKGVVDVDGELLAVDAELHADLEALLLEEGSEQKNLWGINLYPDLTGDAFIEYDSMINMRPSQGNRGRGVEDEKMRRRITEIVAKRVKA
jgi:hypothetical protein